MSEAQLIISVVTPEATITRVVDLPSVANRRFVAVEVLRNVGGVVGEIVRALEDIFGSRPEWTKAEVVPLRGGVR